MGLPGVTRPIEVIDTIESRQIVYPYWFAYHEGPIQYSPNGDTYLLITSRGDVAADANWIEFFSGSLPVRPTSEPLRPSARLRYSAKSALPLRTQFVRWFNGGRSIAFLWREAEQPQQVMALDLLTGELHSMTHTEASVLAFDISERGDVLVYATAGRESDSASQKMLKNGFAVTDQALHQVITGRVGGAEARTVPRYFIRTRDGAEREVPTSSRPTLMPPEISVAPGGRYAIVTAPPQTVPALWSRRYDDRSSYLVGLSELDADASRPTAISQYWLIDTGSGAARPLMQAPRARLPTLPVVWAPTGDRVLIGPTFGPPERTSRAGTVGTAIEDVDCQTLESVELPVSEELQGALLPRAWRKRGEVILSDSGVEYIYRKRQGHWALKGTRAETPARQQAQKLILKQSLNDRPRLTVEDRAELLDLNPQAESLATAKVEVVHWNDPAGRKWTGTLYRTLQPIEHAPLVVQIAGTAPSTSTYSPLGFDIPTCYAAQVLAGRGISVLNLWRPDRGIAAEQLTPREPEIIQEGVESAIRFLAARGSIDPGRVGLVGFSRAGWYVLHILTHSSFEFAAANVCDNLDASYLQYTIGASDFKSELHRDIGAEPFNSGLKAWIDRAPAFRSDAIRAPLRMERDQGGEWGTSITLASWELFSRMRQRGQAVELYLIPELAAGEHQLEGPRQQLASRSGTVNWFDFWLNKRAPVGLDVSDLRRWESLRTAHDQRVAARRNDRDSAPNARER